MIGSGISGLSAAWLLSRQHTVTLYESADRLGGHSSTVDAPSPSGPIAVDTGFIVYNEAQLSQSDRPVRASGRADQAGRRHVLRRLDRRRGLRILQPGLRGLFAQKRNYASPKFGRMIGDICCGSRRRPRATCSALDLSDLTLGAYLSQRRLRPDVPRGPPAAQAAAIWSGSMGQMAGYPAASFMRFYMNHNLLKLDRQPTWRTVDGGSREYVRRLAEAFTGPDRAGVDIGDVVRRRRRRRGALMPTAGRNGSTHVVIATHSDQALRILLDAPRPTSAACWGPSPTPPTGHPALATPA